MSKSLTGARRFSSLDLARIAERSGVTVDWLLSGEEPPLATAARAASGSSAQRAVEEAGRLLELRGSASRLGYPQPWRPVSVGPVGRRGAGEVLAAEALARLESLGLDPADLDLASVLEAGFGVDVCITSLGDGFDGLAASTGEAKLILVALTQVAFRQRFTIAHELGHLLAGDDQGVHLDPDIYSRPPRRDQSEAAANAFAAALLMPETRLREAVRPGFDQAAFAVLALRLKVSPSALAIRLETLRLIDAMTRDAWKSLSAKQATQVAGAPEELAAATRYATAPRRPGLLDRDLFTAYLDERTTLRPYANLLGVDVAKLRDDLERSGEIGG
jgi:Zn-dependent peptidase ImmA (M78 family)